MEWLNNIRGRELSESEQQDLCDCGFSEKVDKILSKSQEKKLKRKERKAEKKEKRYHKKKRKKQPRSTNTEHLIAKTRGGSNHANNLKTSDVKKHAGKHEYLGVELPHEQLIHILDDNFETLHKETRVMIVEEIEQILDYYLNWNELYEPKCFKSKDKIPRRLRKKVNIH